MARISNTTAYPQILNLDLGDYLILTDKENQLMTKSCTVSQLQSFFGIDTLVAHVEGTSAQLQTLASTSKVLIASPGSDKVIDILSISINFVPGTTVYNFGNDLTFDYNSVLMGTLPLAAVNSAANNVAKVMVGSGNSVTLSPGQALNLKTSANPSQGDGKMFINVYYRVLTTGSTF